MAISKSTVLVVDDELAVRQIHRMHCRLAGYEAILANCGAEAIQLALSVDFDLVLTDYRMPNINGVDFCRRLRLIERHKHTPIVMCSGNLDALDRPALQQELAPITFESKPLRAGALPDPVIRK